MLEIFKSWVNFNYGKFQSLQRFGSYFLWRLKLNLELCKKAAYENQ